MSLFQRKENRNADKARNSFVTRRAELKLSALVDLFRAEAGDHFVKVKKDTLTRTIEFTGFHYLDSLKLVYNWENRFMSVNYNLQMVSIVPTDANFEETSDCTFKLNCKQKGLKGNRSYTWKCTRWDDDTIGEEAYIQRLENPLISERLDVLDIMDITIDYRKDWGYWKISCESLIGSSTWILIPPVISMVTPKRSDCIMFMEVFELIGDAIANNSNN